jgi:hypothetical protein
MAGHIFPLVQLMLDMMSNSKRLVSAMEDMLLERRVILF